MGRQDLSRTLWYDLISNVRGVDFLYKGHRRISLKIFFLWKLLPYIPYERACFLHGLMYLLYIIISIFIGKNEQTSYPYKSVY